MTRNAFVTGATGFVGLNLVQRLMTEGWDVTALHRPSSDLTYLRRFNPRLMVGEITDADSINSALPKNCDTVFHVAANTSLWRRKNAEQTRGNVDGTRNVVEACIIKGVRRLVVTSSISAYGPVSGAITEETESLAATSWINYQKTKWEAQEIARAATARGLEVVILQPGGIIGPYDLGNWSRLFYMVRDGKLRGVPPGARTFAHVREVVTAHVAAADAGDNGGQYILGGTNAHMLELVQEIARLLGKPVPARETSLFLVKTVAAVGDLVSTLTGREPSVTPEMADAFGRDITVTADKAKRDLGFQVVPLKTMIKDCYDWM
ncbi:MAG TPA: NAD-dependent epimerase/dehydratase family protein, partial [Gammaproteobacteria bacterium]